ncbi:hypothetical protein ACFQS4_00965 [Saliphagus sp. GCM10025317]
MEVDNESDPLTFTVDFSGDFNDSDTSTVNATFYNETEFNESGTNATEAHSSPSTGARARRG